MGDKAVLSKAAVERTLIPAIAIGAGVLIGFPKLAAYYGQMMIDYVDAARKLVAFGHSGSDGTWAWTRFFSYALPAGGICPRSRSFQPLSGQSSRISPCLHRCSDETA